MKRFLALLLVLPLYLSACAHTESCPAAETTTEATAEIAWAGSADPLPSPPNVGLATVYGEVASCTYATLGAYEWEYPVDDETSASAIACGDHPAASFNEEWLARIEAGKTEGKITFSFYHTLESFTLRRYSEEECLSGSYGEGVPAVIRDVGESVSLYIAEEDLPCLYVIDAVYDLGTAQYTFRVDP
ncbi:MAG: hypothetical protein E7330_01285 [Clostridiales bacterium]|nr:hypothetical protein [Clostridiales bacterium]